ncbi:MAG: IS5 family transposase [Planctomycetota bacterium]|jgi:hypothetical protein
MRRSDFIFRYRVRNWPEYNRALIARGSLTLWVDEQAVSAWRERDGPRGRGRPRTYSDTAIECALVVRSVFHLSLRATQGFLESVVRLMGVDLPVPAYSTVSRRQVSLGLRLQPAPAKRPRHVVIDTTGLKVFGAGEWYVRKHGAGKGKRRIWRKLHMCVDETTKDIVAVDLTTSGVHDSPHFPAVLDGVEGEVGQVSGDRAYDSGTCYEAILARGAVPTIPPRRNARLSRAKDPPPFRVERDAVVRRIRDEGRYRWRTSSGATRQSLAENAVSRFKALVGVKLASRELQRQQVEVLVKSQVLNRMTALGMPRSERAPVG